MIVRGVRIGCALGLLAIGSTMASAHWLSPEEIVAGLATDPHLRDIVGVTRVQNDPKLRRLLIVSVRREVWERVPDADRIKLAEEWLETWRHSVAEGIVAVLDAATEQSVVNFDGLGHARVRQLAPAATPSQQADRHSPG